MTSRLHPLPPAELDAEQRRVYDAVTGGERARGPQLFETTAEDGSLLGPFAVMLEAPRLGYTLQQLGADLRFRAHLPARLREILVLQVAYACGSDYEIYAHEAVGRAIGLTEEELALLQQGRFTSDDPAEAAASAFCTSLLASAEVSDDDFAALREVFTVEQVVELTTLVGYYRMLASLMGVFAIRRP